MRDQVQTSIQGIGVQPEFESGFGFFVAAITILPWVVLLWFAF